MYVYLINYILIGIYGIIIKDKKKLTAIIGMQMFFILAFRNLSVGKIDLNIYASGYDYIGQMSISDLIGRLHIIKNADLIWPYSFESGYVCLNWICSHVGLNFKLFLIIYDGFVVFSWCNLIYKYSRHTVLSFLILVAFGMYTYAFYIIRQSLAVCILLWAYDRIKDNDKIGFWITWIFAFLIHRASIVFLIMYFYRNIGITKRKYVNYLLCICILGATAPIAYNYIIIPLLEIIGKGRYTIANFSYNNQIVLMSGIALLIGVFVDFNNTSVKKDYLIIYAFLFAIIFEIFGMCNDGFARIIEFFYIYIIILIPNMLDANCKSKNAILYRCGIGLALMILYIHTLNGSYIVPYKSILEEMEL